MSIQGRDVLSAIVLFLVLLLFPFLLNWILLRNAIVPVVGDSSSWLAFWSSYVGAILTALMVFATYLTIRKTINLNRAQWRIAWLSSFRAAATELLSAIDPTEVGQMAQDVIFWRFDQAAKKGHAMEIAVKRGSFLLTTALKEYDVVFDAHSGGKYIDELNSFISPFLQRTGEIIQFAIICNYLK